MSTMTDPTSVVTPARRGVPPALLLLARDIKLAHSVFALPFALLAACLAFVYSRESTNPDATSKSVLDWGRLALLLCLVIACMVLARTWAMLVNRLADRSIDAANPRTKNRILASGQVSPLIGWSVAIACAALFAGVASLFYFLLSNAWPIWLALPILLWIALYSYTKRFTWLCHLWLGLSLAMSPIAAAIAVNPASLTQSFALWWIAAFVAVWVAGFDVIYALQDESFDRERGLSSIPATFGGIKALWISRALHAIGLVCLVAAWSTEPRFGALFGIGIAAVAVLLAVEHAVMVKSVRKGDLSRGLNMAFFTLNGIVACVLGALGIADILF